MTISMTCKHCGEVVTAQDEDSLVDRVQAHALTHDHGHGPTLSREHILSRFHRIQRRHAEGA